MNHHLWNRTRARVLAMFFIIATASACGEKLSDVSSGGPSANPVSPSAQVIGVAPGAPQAEPPGTTPVASDTSEVTKAEEANRKPREGDTDNHSTLAPNPAQRAQGSNPQAAPERKTDGRK